MNRHDKYFPEANKWMWNYCLFLGKFTHQDKNYDLGVHEGSFMLPGQYKSPSAAIVYGPQDGNYLSGNVGLFAEKDPIYAETLRRYNAYLEICKGK